MHESCVVVIRRKKDKTEVRFGVRSGWIQIVLTVITTVSPPRVGMSFAVFLVTRFVIHRDGSSSVAWWHSHCGADDRVVYIPWRSRLDRRAMGLIIFAERRIIYRSHSPVQRSSNLKLNSLSLWL